MSDDIAELSTENASLKNTLVSYGRNLLVESKAKLLKQFDDEKRTNLTMSRMEKQMKKKHFCRVQKQSLALFRTYKGRM